MKVLLGVSGSISAYRAADLARDLIRAGHEVRVCLTDGAQQFVTPLLFETLTGQPCLTDAFEEPNRARMAHLDWARETDLILVAPATANTVNQLASGVATDMLTTIILASDAPLVLAPAMNPAMYGHDSVQSARRSLERRGAEWIEPQDGDVWGQETGPGRLARNDVILDRVSEWNQIQSVLRGKRVLITSGPTEEPIDDVRFVSNRSSGKMGSAVARMALAMGAEVTVVAGPQQASLPARARVIHVQTAVQMRDAAIAVDADLIVGVAAVADYRPAHPVSGKLRRTTEALQLEMVPNPDIIAELAAARPRAVVVAFAAEPSEDPSVALEKMRRKGVAAIAMNDISAAGLGFGSDWNAITLLLADGGRETSGVQSKLGCARWLMEQVAHRLIGQTTDQVGQ